MSEFTELFAGPGRRVLSGAPVGMDALLLARAAQESGRDILYVARDDTAMARLAEGLAFFAPDREVLDFPAWDCLPYDRASPHRDIVARRLRTLTRLATGAAGGRVLLTTVNGLLQKVPPPDAFAGLSVEYRVGAPIDVDGLLGFLARDGYVRTGTVMEAGEYAVRGGLIDLFPPGSAEPLRLDLFGDDLEAVRAFDPLSQRTTGARDGFSLMPASELFLDDASIARFRAAYREMFGAVAGPDPLFEAVSAGQPYPGMEHWLALFHTHLVPLSAYMADAVICLDGRAEETRDVSFEQIADHYTARREALGAAAAAGLAPYHPVPPERLYLDRAEWERVLDGRSVATFSPFDAPPVAGSGAVFAGKGRVGRDFAEARGQRGGDLFAAVAARIAEERKAHRRVVVAAFSTGSRARLATLMADSDIRPLALVEDWPAVTALPDGHVALVVLGLEQGFASPDLAVISESDIFGERMVRPTRRTRSSERFIAEASTLSTGDLVVHADHGVGRYEGLETLRAGGAAHDCLRLVYDGGDKLFLPVENIELLSRYGSEDASASLDRLGGVSWQSRKARLKARIRDMAMELITVAAERELRRAEPMTPPDGLYEQFCGRFAYVETEDQQRAIDDCLEDLGKGRSMDRLICGDVGFGKTEVALRAAFVAALAGFQVAVVAPTTLLCRQHYKNFCERFAGFPVRIAQLSRLVSAREAAETRRRLAAGEVDIVIGTHAVLGKSVTFGNLGLLVIDEEQRFGVAQKERIKRLKANVHVLTLTATPIPRTLQLALAGVRDLSLIATPPVDRLAVRSFVLPYDPLVVREGLMREHLRGGQSFYVCPRIEDMAGVQKRLAQLVPEIKLGVAHGQMPPAELERVMEAFYDGAYGVLLSTNIVESGLDIPTANTLVIHRADMFGLAQLYQLRGRIGRAKQRGYAFFTLPSDRVLSTSAQKRLEVMQTLDTLGAGFTLASHDLDIRGAGNLLGGEQSGHIREVGIELYQHMLEEAVMAARGQAPAQEEWTPYINAGTPVLIPEEYVADLGVRLDLYRRVARLHDRGEIDGFAAEMIDRFGALPVEVEYLLDTVAIKQLCRRAAIDRVEAGPKGAVLSFYQNRFAHPDRLVAFIAAQKGTVRLRPDHKLVFNRAWLDPRERVRGLRDLVGELAELAA